MSSTQFLLFRDCMAQQLISRQKIDTATGDSSELDDFVDFLAEEGWSGLPLSLHEATYQSRAEVPEADEVDLESGVSPTFTDTLVSYGVVEDVDDAVKLLRKVVEAYRAEACAPPPVWSSTRTKECEICEREVPLTYHHLIPKSVHEKVVKKGWHDESMLGSVAWLCRPCHSMVHHVARCEELAKEYYTIELLLQREDIQKWQKYASKQRWGSRPKKVYRAPV
ncbi:hypothetical protein P691DRAFT_683602 [Macrolepiota fuliginosa MF-IS2]|uniref:HNH domain-containing protein n=1 Tax=Macrolepiota fuliginosa MF-IS2 TaxID=1400762 RepID=A0A9P5X1D3_9AGAR|nr:hypothetical protein P691DRAFT_683602 [Macrolepiota fuliginosa MF-IS2]